MAASETESGTSSTQLAGVQVYVSHRVSHRAAKIKRWRRLLPVLGAQLLEDPSSVVTHIVNGNSDSDQDSKLMSKACHVTVEWLEQCLALQKRVPEKDAGHFGQTRHTAKAEAKSVMQPAVEQSDVQRALLSVTAGDLPPNWMNTQGRKAGLPLVVMMIPGLDQQLFQDQQMLDAGQKILPQMTECLGTPTPVKAKHVGVHPVQASRSFLTVSASALPASKKRKREPPANDSPHKVSMMPIATSPTRLPDNTCTASCSATAVSTSDTGTASAVHSACPAPLADAVTASGSTAVPFTTAAAPSFPLEHYEVTLAQMQAANYPLPAETASGQKVLPMGFVAANQDGQSSQHQRIVAVDCEMCYTRTALELTRLTLVDENEQVLLDELVLPDTPIVNYNTAFSGISPALMKGVTTTLAQVQQRILQFVGPETFLVGHSLENDLRVMKLVHLKNLDTAIMYPNARWPVQQNSLRWLSDHYLQQTIQSGAHDSKEDAVAALRLVNLKLQQGPFFDKSQNADTHNLIGLLHKQDRKCAMLDRHEVLAGHASSTCKAIACLSDEQAVNQAGQCLQQGSADVIWLQLWTLADLYENRAYRQHARQKWPYPIGYPNEAVFPQKGKESIEESLRLIDAHIDQVYNSLQSGSMLLVVTGQGDTTQQRLKENHVKEVRQNRQLAKATGTKVSGQGKGYHTQDRAIPGNTLVFCAVK